MEELVKEVSGVQTYGEPHGRIDAIKEKYQIQSFEKDDVTFIEELIFPSGKRAFCHEIDMENKNTIERLRYHIRQIIIEADSSDTIYKPANIRVRALMAYALHQLFYREVSKSVIEKRAGEEIVKEAELNLVYSFIHSHSKISGLGKLIQDEVIEMRSKGFKIN